jgi:hypothetical protein
MRRAPFPFALFVSLVCAPVLPLSRVAAQAAPTSAVHVGALLGISLPGGTLQSVTGTGWNAGAFVSVGRSQSPLGLRIDGQWDQFGGKAQLAGDRPTEFDDFRIIDATANAVYTFPGATAASFYIIGGGGVYNERSSVHLGSGTTNETITRPGVNAGAGVRLQLRHVAGVLEIRYHYIVHGSELTPYKYFGGGHQGIHFFPLSVGIVL